MPVKAQSCPVSGTKVDETVVRLIAAQVLILVSIATIGQSFILSAIIVLDFATRAFGFGQYSLFKTVAKGIKSSLSLKGKVILSRNILLSVISPDRKFAVIIQSAVMQTTIASTIAMNDLRPGLK